MKKFKTYHILLVIPLLFLVSSCGSSKTPEELVSEILSAPSVSFDKDKTASYVNSYSNNKFFVIKDHLGTVLEEVELKIAKYRVKGNDAIFGDLDDLLSKYIEFHNKNSKKQADQMRSRKRGDDFILCDVNNQIIKKISVDDSLNELGYAEFGEVFLRKKKEN